MEITKIDMDITTDMELTSGQTIEDDANASIDATFHLNGGMCLDDIKVYGNSKLKMDAGEVIDGIGLYADGKKSYIEGGAIGGSVFVGDESVSHELEITGGLFNGDRIEVHNESSVTFIGHGFNYSFGNIRDGESNRTGILTGILENGDPISLKFRIFGSSNIVLEED